MHSRRRTRCRSPNCLSGGDGMSTDRLARPMMVPLVACLMLAACGVRIPEPAPSSLDEFSRDYSLKLSGDAEFKGVIVNALPAEYSVFPGSSKKAIRLALVFNGAAW